MGARRSAPRWRRGRQHRGGVPAIASSLALAAGYGVWALVTTPSDAKHLARSRPRSLERRARPAGRPRRARGRVSRRPAAHALTAAPVNLRRAASVSRRMDPTSLRPARALALAAALLLGGLAALRRRRRRPLPATPRRPPRPAAATRTTTTARATTAASRLGGRRRRRRAGHRVRQRPHRRARRRVHLRQPGQHRPHAHGRRRLVRLRRGAGQQPVRSDHRPRRRRRVPVPLRDPPGDDRHPHRLLTETVPRWPCCPTPPCARPTTRTGRSSIASRARALGDAGLAEDAVQEAFVRAWRASASYDPARSSQRTWLFAILRNVVIDFARARRSRPPVAAGRGRRRRRRPPTRSTGS